MHLLSVLIKREFVDNLTSGRYILTSMVCVVLFLSSAVLMSHDYVRRVQRFSLSHHTYGNNTVAKPPQPLSVVAKGVEEVIGRATLPQGPRDQPVAHFFNYNGEEHHLFDLFQTPDFVYIIGVILSALAIFLSFDGVCGEKETHTLSLVMSHSLPRGHLLFAKWIGGYASFLVSLCPALVLLLIFLAAFSGVPLTAGHWGRLMLILVISVGYLSVFFTLGLLISVLTHRPSTSLILALFIWSLWALGVTRVGILAGKAATPVYDEHVLRLEKERLVPDWKDQFIKQNRDRLWKMDDEYITRAERQIRTGQYLSRLSPLASYVYASTTLAQTGAYDYRDYCQQFARWNRGRIRTERESRTTEFIDRFYHPLGLRASGIAVGIDVALLAMWNIVLFMGANLAFLRYDVR